MNEALLAHMGTFSIQQSWRLAGWGVRSSQLHMLPCSALFRDAPRKTNKPAPKATWLDAASLEKTEYGKFKGWRCV